MPPPPKFSEGHFEHADLYAVLNVTPGADAAEIRTAYRRAALLAHPDKGGSGEAFHLVTHAFNILAGVTSCTLEKKTFPSEPPSSKSRPCAFWPGNSRKRKASAPQPCDTGQDPKRARLFGEVPAPHTGPPREGSSHARPSRICSKTSCAIEARLERLRAILQAMTIQRRQAAVLALAQRVRTLLLAFMDARKKVPCTQCTVKMIQSPGGEEAQYPADDSDHLDDESDHSDTVTQFAILDYESTDIAKHGKLTETADACTYKQKNQREGAPRANRRKRAYEVVRQRMSVSGVTGIQTDKRKPGSKYKAHMNIKSLRLYTNGNAKIEVAIEHYIILVQIREALLVAVAEDPGKWEKPEEIDCICSQVLRENSTSAVEIGLTAFVSIQAPKWLAKTCTIMSPVMSFTEAVHVHARMRRARQTSWEALRAEWVELMQYKRYIRAKIRTEAEAHAIADEARKRFLIQSQKREQELFLRKQARILTQKKRQEERRYQLGLKRHAREQQQRQRQIVREQLLQSKKEELQIQRQATLDRRLAEIVRGLERALDYKERAEARLQCKVAKAQAREKAREKSQEKAEAQRNAAIARKARAQKSQQANKRQKWLRRGDLTTDEIMRGVPT